MIKGIKIYIGSRLHFDDEIGYPLKLRKNQKIKHICLKNQRQRNDTNKI